jgi:glycine reductase
MDRTIRIVHYLNQFFGQIGGEDKAHQPPLIKKGPEGPGVLLQSLLKDKAQIVYTIICGDGYMGENTERGLKEIDELLKGKEFDVLVAGPAFNAGRYGFACGAVGSYISRKYNIPCVTGMYEENPGVEMYRKDIYIFPTGKSAAQMRNALEKMTQLICKLGLGEELKSAAEEGYIPRGIRRNLFREKRGAERAVEMLLKKIKGEDYMSEIRISVYDRVDPSPPVKNLKKAKIALVTTGGIVKKGNPDRLQSANATKYLRYSIKDVDSLRNYEYETIHAGYDPVYANDNPNRIIPVDILKELEKEGVIGSLYEYIYVTTGNSTSVATATNFGREIAAALKKDKVDAVILTST